ncbi:hypothetical protein VMT65_26225 [Nocardia sp. CDC153]|uniref:hypothetical protein n=1 Tax=Nocardia sp. CDC153 TaxID=3112167 RepID=UPI002DB6A688|nr:hypothetical protein [Nocardia sp. CDC153]MEC3956558.1 hypothetical protein [Nocardia sp. CDC153]
MSDTTPVSWDHLKSRQPTATERDALQAQLVERGRAVARDGWDAHRESWTPGECAAVAYLLEDTAVLEELEEHEGSILTRFAGELYGFQGARKEIASGLVDTQAWFAAARAQLKGR